MPGRRLVAVTTGRHPFEIAFLISCAVVGPLLIAGDTRPRSVTAAMPQIVQVAWEYGVAGAGIIGLIAVLNRRWTLATSLTIELSAMWIAGTSLAMYATALIVVNGSAATASGAFVLAFAAGAWSRFIQIIRDLRRAGRAAQAGATAEVPLLIEEQE